MDILLRWIFTLPTKHILELINLYGEDLLIDEEIKTREDLELHGEELLASLRAILTTANYYEEDLSQTILEEVLSGGNSKKKIKSIYKKLPYIIPLFLRYDNLEELEPIDLIKDYVLDTWGYTEEQLNHFLNMRLEDDSAISIEGRVFFTKSFMLDFMYDELIDLIMALFVIMAHSFKDVNSEKSNLLISQFFKLLTMKRKDIEDYEGGEGIPSSFLEGL